MISLLFLLLISKISYCETTTEKLTILESALNSAIQTKKLEKLQKVLKTFEETYRPECGDRHLLQEPLPKAKKSAYLVAVDLKDKLPKDNTDAIRSEITQINNQIDTLERELVELRRSPTKDVSVSSDSTQGITIELNTQKDKRETLIADLEAQLKLHEPLKSILNLLRETDRRMTARKNIQESLSTGDSLNNYYDRSLTSPYSELINYYEKMYNKTNETVNSNQNQGIQCPNQLQQLAPIPKERSATNNSKSNSPKNTESTGSPSSSGNSDSSETGR